MTTDNALNALEEILGNLPDEDKKRLAALLTKDLPPPNPLKDEKTERGGLLEKAPKKRKQNRGGKVTANKPVKRQKKKKQHRGMGEGTGRTKFGYTESMELGPKQNRCDDKNDIYYIHNALHRKDAADDKLLQGNNKPTPRLGRKPEYITAKCSKCEYEFDNVPANICYSDDEGVVFCCDDCGKKH